MSTPSWKISRRTMLRSTLRGVGVAIALPMLEAMGSIPLSAAEPSDTGPGFTRPKSPVRMLMMNLPCGTYHNEWGVDKPGPIGTLKPMTAPLQPYAGDILLFSNLRNQSATVNDLSHYTNEQLWTSTVVKRTDGADLNVGGVSMDQVVARCTASVTRFPSINMGMMKPYGGIDSGWSRAYNNQLSWSTPTTPVANEIDPKRAFDQLFRVPGQKSVVGTSVVDTTDARPLTIEDKKSVLDYVGAESGALKRKVGVTDQRKLDEYLTSVRDVEKQLQREIKELAKERRIDPAAVRSIGQLDGKLVAFDGKDHTQRLRIMLDIMTLAFWTDSTRVGTFMFGHERNDLNYSFIPGVHSAHHDSSHHGGGGDALDQYRKINIWHAEQVAYVIGRMKAIKEPNDQTLLDNSMIFWGSPLHDGNDHVRENLPIMLAGRGGGLIKTGRHIVMPDRTPLANLYLSMQQFMGLQSTSFADSTKPIVEMVKA